jgi:nucleoside-diphosphate-sugar epimerase
MPNEITETAPLNVFITGATSALGRELVRRLSAAGHHVVGATSGYENAALVRADGGIPAFPDLLRAGELRSVMQGSKTDVAISVAPQLANHLPQQPAHWDTDLLDAGTAALVEAAAAANVKFLVHTSYAFADAHVDEHDPHAADLAKLLAATRAGEQHVLDHASAVPGCVLRFGFLYGAESPEILAIRDTLTMRRPLDSGSADSHALWIYVPDAARAVIAGLTVQPSGARLSIVDDRPLAPAAFLNYFAQSQGLALPEPAPRYAFWAQPKPGQAALMALSPHADNAEAKAVLGWSPRFSNNELGIEDLLLTWRAGAATPRTDTASVIEGN